MPSNTSSLDSQQKPATIWQISSHGEIRVKSEEWYISHLGVTHHARV